MERVTHHGRSTAYRCEDRGDTGDGPPMLCVHGSGGTHDVWKGQLGRLSADRSVVAIDLSGHGASEDVETPPGEETLSAYAADVVAVACETDARVLVGNSLGGAVILHLLVSTDFDVELDAVVLAGTGAKLAVLGDLLEWLDDDFERAVEFLHGPDRLFHTRDDRYLDVSKDAIRETGRAVTRRDFRSCHTFDVRDRLGDIAVPALALTGEYDGLTPPWYHEYLADNIPSADWHTIDDAAHLSMLERPGAFNDTVTSFLRDVL